MLNPLNADFAFELARYQSWMAWRGIGVSTVSKIHREAATENYRAAVTLRPAWGFAWISLAESSLAAQRDIEEVHYALRHAIALSPWEPATQLKVLLVGFSAWETLPEGLRQGVQDTVKRAIRLENSVDQVIQLAIQTGRTEQLSSALTQKRHRVLFERIRRESAGP